MSLHIDDRCVSAAKKDLLHNAHASQMWSHEQWVHHFDHTNSNRFGATGWTFKIHAIV